MENILEPAIRIVIIYFSLLIFSRIMGRKMISQMTFFDFVVGITIGSVAATSSLGSFSDSLLAGLTILTVLTILVVLIDYLHIKSFKFRKLVDSEPLVVIERGQIVVSNMKKERLTLQHLTALLRNKNIFNIADVEFAILEHNGKLSVLPKSQMQPLRAVDMNIQRPYQGLTKDVIIDGKFMKENLEAAKLSKEWLLNQLHSMKIEEIANVFYAGLDSSQNLYVSIKSHNQENDGKYGENKYR